MPHSLLFFPDYRAANPYQTLMYSHTAPELHPRAASIDEALAIRHLQAPDDGMLFHLHWEDAVYRHEPDEPSARAAARAFLDKLETFQEGGGAVLWTIHNEAPHEARWPDLHHELRHALARLADLVHVHSTAGLAWAMDGLGIEPRRLVLAAHGNYRPLFHPLGAERAVSRSALGLPVTAELLLLFGRIEPYKGAEPLLQALAGSTDERLHVVIAGKQIQPIEPLLEGLPAWLRARVHRLPGFVEPERVPALFHAADAVVMPYRAILSSGTALLALSLNRPVIAAAHPGILDLMRDGVHGLLYPPDDPAGLASAIARFRALPAEERRQMELAAGNQARLFDWAVSGNSLGGAMQRLLALRRPMRRLGG